MLKYLIFIVLIAGLAVLSSCEQKNYDDFVQCLTENGIKMYGSYWCGHCNAQKEAFGESVQYLTYVECSLPDGGGQTEECAEAGIEGYPTWEFQHGVRKTGKISFDGLSRISGCELP